MSFTSTLLSALLFASLAFAQSGQLGDADIMADMQKCYDHLFQKVTIDPDDELNSFHNPDVPVLVIPEVNGKGIYIYSPKDGRAALAPFNRTFPSNERIPSYQYQTLINGKTVNIRYQVALDPTAAFKLSCDFGKPDSMTYARTVKSSAFTINNGPEIENAFMAEIERRISYRMLNYHDSVGPHGEAIPFKDSNKFKSYASENDAAIKACKSDLGREIKSEPDFHEFNRMLEHADDVFTHPAGTLPVGGGQTSDSKSNSPLN